MYLNKKKIYYIKINDDIINLKLFNKNNTLTI